MEYKLNNNFNTRLDYQFIYNLGQKNIFHEEPNNNLLTISLIYNLNKENSDIIVKNNNNFNNFNKTKNINFGINYFKNIFYFIKKKNSIIKYIKIKNINKNNKILYKSNIIYLNIKNIIKKIANKKKYLNLIKFNYNINNYKKFKCNKFKNKNNKLYNKCLNYLDNKIFIKIYIKRNI